MQKQRILDCSDMDESGFHDAIATCLDFPEYYGRNMDALWDCLTMLEGENIRLIVKSWVGFEKSTRGAQLLSTLREANNDIDGLAIEFQ